MKNFASVAEQYARDVVDGRVLACKLVKLACLRHLDGLARQSEDGHAYVFDAKAAARVCAFVELMPHVKGRWARDRLQIVLEPWQVFFIANVFGWKRKKDGLRRYRRVYVEVPRKNAKSTTTAAVAHYMLTADDEHGAEVYSGATSEKQAWEVFGPARLMAKGSDDYRDAFGVEVGARNMHVPATASKFEPIIGKPGDGASPSFSITDEYHEHPTSEQYDTMVTGMGSREQPIAWVITTAGYDTAGPCYSLRGEAVNALQGTTTDDELFALIYTVDEGDEWDDPKVLIKCNPNYGVSVSEDFLTSQLNRAKANPREQVTFKTKHLNIWGGAGAPYFNLDLWMRLNDAPPIEEFRGERCVIGLDLASKLDIAAAPRVFRRTVDGRPHFYVYSRLYLPRPRAESPEGRHYAGWAEQGHLIATLDETTDYDVIEDDIKADAALFARVDVAADPYNATQLLTHLQRHLGEDRVSEVRQTVSELSEPMKELQALIERGHIHHDGNPCMSWMIGNVTAQEDRNQNVFPRKERPEQKIDGPVALINALSRMIVEAPDPELNIYLIGA